MNVSMIICAPLKKSPNCASQMIKWFGFSILMPYSKPRQASSDKGLLTTCVEDQEKFFSEIYFTSTKVSRQVSDRKSVGLEEFVMEILRRIVLNTSRNPFCCSDILFSGTNISSVCWSTSIVCLWLNVPLPTSCPLKRTWYPVKRKVRTKLIA